MIALYYSAFRLSAVRYECCLLVSDYISQFDALFLGPFCISTWPTIFLHLIQRFSFLPNQNYNSHIPQSLSPIVRPLSLDWTSSIQTFLFQTFSATLLIDVYELSLSNFEYHAFRRFTFSMQWLTFSLYLLLTFNKILFHFIACIFIIFIIILSLWIFPFHFL